MNPFVQRALILTSGAVLLSDAALASDKGGLSAGLTIRLENGIAVKSADGHMSYKDLELYPTCTNGVWEKDVLGWALFPRPGYQSQNEWRFTTDPKSHNAMDHEGTITSATVDGTAIALNVKVAVNPDPWVKGGAGEYAIALKRDGDRLTGTHTGRFEGMDVEGSVSGTVKPGLWPAPVPGYVPLQPGEHPRLMFRASDVPALREKAKTPEGKAMLARLEENLRGPFTLWHGCGYGLLYQVYGDRKYAEQAKEYVDMARSGKQQKDSRYSYTSPNGRLRAGPSYAAIAEAYDLCYEAWDPEYRKTLAKEIQEKVFNTGGGNDLTLKTGGGQHHPQSNHYMAWNGGGGTAMIAVLGDPGVDNPVAMRAIRLFESRAKRSLNVSHGDHGYFFEGHHCGRLNNNTGLFEFMQALRVAMGRDLLTGSDSANWLLTKWIYELARYGGKLDDAERGMYARDFARTGLSSGGDFAHGFGNCPEAFKPAVLWFANHLLDPPGEQRYDIMSYPHRGAYAFVNWPVGMKERNPAEILPRYLFDRRANYVVVRTGWKDEGDIVLTMRDGLGMCAGAGLDGVRFGSPAGMIQDVGASTDGLLITIDCEKTVTLVDVSGKSGVPLVLMTADRERKLDKPKAGAEFGKPVPTVAPATAAKKSSKKRGEDDEPEESVASEGASAVTPPPAKMKTEQQWAGGYRFDIILFSNGTMPEVGTVGDWAEAKLRIGNRTYGCDGKAILTADP